MQILDIYGERFTLKQMHQDVREDGTRCQLGVSGDVADQLLDNVPHRVVPCWIMYGREARAYFHAALSGIEFMIYENMSRIELMVVSRIYWKHYDNGPQAIRRQYRAVSGELVQRL